MTPLASLVFTMFLVIPTDAEILRILKQRVDDYRWSVGMVVGVIEPAGRRVVAYGTLAKDDPRPVRADTVFEIGSITKVFTSLLLADAVQRGEAALDDPISKYLPPGQVTPERNGRSITLRDLSMHLSGLPQVLGNPNSTARDNPYTGYSVEHLYQFLSTFQLRRDIGSRFEYSNLGSGLLGHVLARRNDTDYEALLASRITGPLGLKDTRITLTPEMKERLAVGHGPGLRPVAPWDMPTLSAAGALRSTANDLLGFLSVVLGYTESPLSPALESMLNTRQPIGDSRGTEIGLGWIVYKHTGSEIIGHGGDTSGFQSAIAFDLKTRSGVVVLSNSSALRQVADIGMHLLDSRYSLDRPGPIEARIDPERFDRHAGKYELQTEPRLTLTLTREADQFFVQAEGQSKLELFAEDALHFFLKVTDARITFQTDADGRTTGLILHQNGFDEPGVRLE